MAQQGKGTTVTEAVKGVLAIVAACVIWGLSGLFYKALTHIPAIEIMAHRTIWGAVLFLIVLALQGRASEPGRVLGRRRGLGVILLAALMVGINWFTFVLAVQLDKALEASLGYFIFPLVAVALGVLAFGERLSRMQAAAVGLAALAVLLLTVGLGVPPWIALLLGITFGIYGMLKKRLDMGPVLSVTVEAILLIPVAGVILLIVHGGGGGSFGAGWFDSVMLMLSGPMTATPLILFSYGARRAAMASVGLISYLNPTLQFLVATLIFHEPFGPWHAVSFALIWTALAIYTTSRWRQDRAAARRSPRS